MPIVSLSVPDSLMRDLELMTDVVGYSSRSEAIRDAIRTYISEQRMYRRVKEDVFNAIMFLYKNGEDERQKLERLRSKYSKLIEGEITFAISKDRKVSVLLTRGKSDEIRMLTSRIRGIKGMEQTRYIMAEQ